MVNKRIFIYLIALGGVASYANSLTNGFVWDDYSHICDNQHIKDIAKIPALLTEDIGAGSAHRYNFYRPLQMMIYVVEYHVWGLDPSGYHFANITLHILTACAVFNLLALLYGNQMFAFLTAILFVTHPVNTEAVTYISDKADSLAALCMILSLIFYIRYRREGAVKKYVVSLAAAAAALLSKEGSIILPVLIVFHHYIFGENIRIKALVPYGILICAFMVLRSLSLHSPALPFAPASVIWPRVPGFFAAVTNYLRITAAPFDLRIDYGDRLFKLNDPRVLAGIGFFVFSVFYVLKRRKDAVISFGLGWFFITLAPMTNIFPINNSYMMEHWLYLPVIGLLMCIVQAVSAVFAEHKNLGIGVMLTAAVVLSALTMRQNRFWRDERTLYERALRYVPDSSRLLNNLCVIYTDSGEYAKAIDAGLRATTGKPRLPAAFRNLANAYLAAGNVDEAAKYEQKARMVDAHAAQGSMLKAQGAKPLSLQQMFLA